MKKGANFLRDVVEFINSRNEHLNDDKTVKQLITDFMESEKPDPNHYDEHGRSVIGYSSGLPQSVQEALNSGDGIYRP